MYEYITLHHCVEFTNRNLSFISLSSFNYINYIIICNFNSLYVLNLSHFKNLYVELFSIDEVTGISVTHNFSLCLTVLPECCLFSHRELLVFLNGYVSE